jgi:hypothetical protein
VTVVVAGLAGATACSDPGEGVASLHSGSAEEAAALEQYRGAEALVTCLTAANLPARLTPVDSGQAAQDWEEGHAIMWTIGDSSWGSTATVDSAVEAAFEARTAEGTLPGLFVDGQDHTETWTRCLDTSGYVDPWFTPLDPAAELQTKRRHADATNAWIACAREHGMPELEDVTPVVDGGATYPRVEIPLTTTPDALRALVEACPHFDEDQAKRRSEPGFDTENDVPDPTIEVQLPPEPTASTAPNGADQSDEARRYSELQAILWDPITQFFEQNPQPGEVRQP